MGGNINNTNCLFCNIDEGRVIAENEFCFAINDKYAVTPLHVLIIPKRHILTYFDLTQSEIIACTELMAEQKKKIENEDSTVTGFNVGMNSGESAGQTIFHCHIHLLLKL